jgi:hypothetical protein
MTGNLRDAIPLAGGEWLVSFTTSTPPVEWFDNLKGKPVAVEIKKASQGRSKDANAFCWALCSDIGKALTPPLSKEDVYRKAIKAVGVYWQTEIPLFHLENVRRRWESHGTGWFMEAVDDSAPGRKQVHMYFGTSTYTVDEMRVLIDWLVDQCQQMQLPIPLSKADEEKMLERWGKHVTSNGSD